MVTPINRWSPEPIQNIAIKELQDAFLSGYVPDGDFTSLVTQSGSPIDTPKQVSYGSNKVSTAGIVDYTNGVFTFLKSGPIAIKSRLRVGRVGASGISHLYFWAESSIDGGTVWNKIGNTINIHLDNSTETQTFFDFAALSGITGLKLRTMFARSSTGDDSGDLIASTPSATLTGLGVQPSPSAQITLYRHLSYNYK